MLGQLSVLGTIYPVTHAELHVPALYGTRLMYLRVSTEHDGGFGIWEVDLSRLEGLNELDGKRIHIRWEGDAFEDDTLGTDTTGVEDTTDLNYLQADGENYGYREVLVDFTRLQSHQYRVEARFVLMSEDEDPANDVSAMAELLVEVDEQDPFASSR